MLNVRIMQLFSLAQADVNDWFLVESVLKLHRNYKKDEVFRVKTGCSFPGLKCF